MTRFWIKVGMKEYSNKMPHQISGEQQRVASLSAAQ
jgi:ABC-type polar amino acid transport system ATPase subunit